MSDRYVPVTYEPQKAEKAKVDYKKLYKTDVLSFDPLIGYITNVSTTLYEVQSQFDKGSPEYNELQTRLKLCCYFQSAAIDAAKGIAFEGIPKHWIRKTKITDDMTEEEVERAEFNNRICIESHRPYFMRYLYTHKNREYRDFVDDLNRMSIILYGKPYGELEHRQEMDDKIAESLQNFADNGNPLLETNGTMNRICRYMEQHLSGVKSYSKKISEEENQEIIESLVDAEHETDWDLLPLIDGLRKKYIAFKKEHALSDSEFNTYDQFYESLRNEAMEGITNDETELANLAVITCYRLSTGSKDFCWDCFGDAIYENVLGNKSRSDESAYIHAEKCAETTEIHGKKCDSVGEIDTMLRGLYKTITKVRLRMPVASDKPDITYLGKNYSMKEFVLEVPNE